ncbi:hypothetical protein MPTK1_2g25070 [Marchantia polymorpha subsp. ruderalis]|uniref:Uncharacterized protein n=1 Tax=Marchantia polymorpha TaxID=3197 RepID=A0A2R6W366_MARPO|nr:hypothetical protein MARPO_0168s0026 [Marchantia polymorpha]BBN03638.1 hypothetical protein Mp_2g25070 [Marchantia polymorpha subsp. ruderalis]|eukprot:PTQ28304.1 hypothetical protein MARPO_0168s0026 [Marchantia polymorpha]
MSTTKFQMEERWIPFRTPRIKLRRLEDILNDEASLLRSDCQPTDFGYGRLSDVSIAAGPSPCEEVEAPLDTVVHAAQKEGPSPCREDNAPLDTGGDLAQKGGPRNRIWRPSNINCSSPEKVQDSRLERVVHGPRGDQPTSSNPTPKDHHYTHTVASPKESSTELGGFRDVDKVQDICNAPKISPPPSESRVSKRRRLRRLSEMESSNEENTPKELEVKPAKESACDFDLNQPPPLTWKAAPYKPKKHLYSRYIAERKAFEESDSDDARSIDCDVEIETVLQSLRKELDETVELDDSISDLVRAHQGHSYDCTKAGARHYTTSITKPRDGQYPQTTSEELGQLARRARLTYEL